MICPKCGCTEEDVQSKIRGLCLDCHTPLIVKNPEPMVEIMPEEIESETTEREEDVTESGNEVPENNNKEEA